MIANRLPSLTRSFVARKPVSARISSTLPATATRFFSVTAVPFKKVQSQSPIGPIGVEAALIASKDPSFKPRPTLLQDEFSLQGRVAVVSGGNRGLGLEMAEALCEAGAAVYCLDLPAEPGDEWTAARRYVDRLGVKHARLEYASLDVTDQNATWDLVKKIGDKEKRMDICVAAAGILAGTDCLDYPTGDFQKIMSVNVNGVLHTAQAAGRQMVRFGLPGSIVLIASMSGSITNRVSTATRIRLAEHVNLRVFRTMPGLDTIRVNLP